MGQTDTVSNTWQLNYIKNEWRFEAESIKMKNTWKVKA